MKALFLAGLILLGLTACTDEELEMAGMMAPRPVASTVKAASATKQAFIEAISGGQGK